MSARRAISTFASFGVGRFLALGTGLLLAKVAGPTAWGAVSTVRSVFETVLTYARGGSEQLVYGRMAGVSPADFASEVTHVQRISCWVSSVLAAASLVWLGLIAYPAELDRGEWILGVLLIAAATPVLAVSQLYVSVSVARGTGRSQHAENIALPLVRFAVAVALILVLPPFIAISAGFLASAAVVLYLSKDLAVPIDRYVRRARLNGLRQFNSVGLNHVLSGLMSRFDIALVGLVLGLGVAGTYAIAHSIAGLISVIGASHGRLLAPRVGALLKIGRRRRAHQLVRRARRLTLLVCVPAVAVTGYAYRGVTEFLGASFAAGAFVIWLLLCSYALIATFSYSGLLLSLEGKSRIERRSILSYAAVLTIGLPMFVPNYGLPGAAVVCLTATLILAWHRGRLVRRQFKNEAALGLGGLSIVRALIVLSPAVAAALADVHLMPSLLQSFAWLVAYLAVQIPVLFWVGLNRGERRFLRQVLRRLT